MPEHETFDLDAAFRALEHDIAGASSPRGAGAAIATARRRRRTTVGAIAAVAVLAVGGVVIAQGARSTDHAVAPSDQPLPSPSALSVDALDQASAGWMSDWTRPSRHAANRALSLLGPLTCIAARDGQGVLDNAESTGHSVFASGSDGVDVVVGEKVSSQNAAKAQEQMQALVDTCAPGATAQRAYTDGSSATYSQVDEGRRGDFFIWTARQGDRIGLMVATGAAHPPSDSSVARMADLLVGALQVDSTVTGDQLSGGSASASASGSGSGDVFIQDGQFQSALGSWSGGWSATNGDAPSALPCGVDLAKGESFGAESSLGANGQQQLFGYNTATAAQQRARTASDRFRACPSYQVGQVPLSNGTSVTVAAGTGSGQQVVWLVRQGRTLDVVQVPAGDSAPPDSADQAVGELLDQVITAYMSPEPGAPSSAGPGRVTVSHAPAVSGGSRH
jgi:hypothetical protein